MVFFSSVHGGDLPISAPLSEVLTLASRRDQLNEKEGYDVERYKALWHLEHWPKVSVKDEDRIAAVFVRALHSDNASIRTEGATGLGRRGRNEMIPTILKLGLKDFGIIPSFFYAYEKNHEAVPPVELFRRNLRSKNPKVKFAALDAIWNGRIVALRTDVEAVFRGNVSDLLRGKAAGVLVQLESRESAPVLRRAFDAGLHKDYVVFGLIRLGEDSDVALVLPMLKSNDLNIRMTILRGLCGATLADSKPTCDVLLESLGDLFDDAQLSTIRILSGPSHELRLSALQTLSHFHDIRAIPLIKKLMIPPRLMTLEERSTHVAAVAAIGGAEAIELLDEMMAFGYCNHFGLEEALLRFAAPSSGRAIWKQYLKDPIHETLGDVTSMGYYNALQVLAVCADADLFLEIRVQLVSSKDSAEKIALEKLLEQIKTRLGK